jgi:hypothetical protein
MMSDIKIALAHPEESAWNSLFDHKKLPAKKGDNAFCICKCQGQPYIFLDWPSGWQPASMHRDHIANEVYAVRPGEKFLRPVTAEVKTEQLTALLRECFARFSDDGCLDIFQDALEAADHPDWDWTCRLWFEIGDKLKEKQGWSDFLVLTKDAKVTIDGFRLPPDANSEVALVIREAIDKYR